MTPPVRPTTNRFVNTVLIVLAAAMSGGAVLGAQSLAEVARRQAEHLSTVHSPARTYTNADLPALPVAPPRQETSALRMDPIASSAGETEGAPSAGSDVAIASAQALALDDRGEDYWRQRALTIRRRVVRAESDVAALQARVQSNLDSPAGSAAGEQAVTLAVLGGAQDDLRALNEEWLSFEAQAQLANVPPAWLQ